MARDRGRWHERLSKDIKQAAKDRGWKVDAIELVTVELVLTLARLVSPGEPASGAWAQLKGYRFTDAGEHADHSMSVIVWLVGELKSEPVWREALSDYLSMPEQLRAYLLDGPDDIVPPHRRPPLVGDRHDDYLAALAQFPPHRGDDMPVAQAGENYWVAADDGRETITIPTHLPEPGLLTRHDFSAAPQRRPVHLDWQELVTFAAGLDDEDRRHNRDSQRWHSRFEDLILRLRQTDDTFTRAATLDLTQLHHLAGMVGAGKSTLMDLLAIWAARHQHRITIVVADVVSVLNRVELYRRYGVTAAPVLGASGRGRHIQQLHRPGVRRTDGLTAMDTPLLRWASSACALSSQRTDPQPWHLDEAPCLRLKQDQIGPRGGKTVVDHVCPLWTRCQRHHASRELVDAKVWVTTPAGLVFSRVPQPLIDVNLRYLELAWYRSDLIIVDEADQVQTQLDGIFSPSQTLAGDGDDAWMDVIDAAKKTELRARGRGPMRIPKIARWVQLVDNADMLISRIYALLGDQPHLRAWVGDGYFNEWTLAVRLTAMFARVPTRPDAADNTADAGNTPPPIDPQRAQAWRKSFSAWSLAPTKTEQPTQDRHADKLRRFSEQTAFRDDAAITKMLATWLSTLTDITPPETAEDRTDLALKLHFTLLVGILTHHISSITGRWNDVEGPLRMRGHGSSLVHRPPIEYVAMVPDSPMGNLIGLQYQHDDDAHPDRLGSLRFFRCNGIGRWLLLNLANLYADQHAHPPGVLLMSATSWAGTSPRYDLQVPVTGVLQAPPRELAGINASVFHYSPQRYGTTDKRINISGTPPDKRPAALAAMVEQLARIIDDGLGAQPSKLEQQRDALPPGRQRIMLLVGSYSECAQVEATLLRARPDWNEQILRLIPDDASYTHQWTGRTLARGSVAELRHTDAWLLIAPLLAVERGHNILNDERVAALGAAYFLVRPHPRPDDISYHVQDINRWGVEQIRNGLPAAGPATIAAERAKAFIAEAGTRWRRALAHPLMLSRMNDDEQTAFMWTQLVTIWQVIGRLVRGGQAATIHFCDAAFDPSSDTSLLVGMHRVLTDARAGKGIRPQDVELATILYEPLHRALTTLLEPYRAL
ncbi:hypothetical protein Q0Z83_000210 [Actinoplanes sichuanensis]|uniref:pPIWI-RE three-gene island domain-containing protein n=1 Tax=Actinoplanes sichuanensis TaxID=512349 RepID=A0ABW4A1L6_9ACTN|nr:hypothetical protein [Actinoplanes sichuanensis]BEL01830.1 hypothetical protein Q0Z83_000210 [Actinoplanes sichuanensis]